jgi:NAD(P)-dependent dehydrogenase (short-subunit alcohol dehydrogenase family)
VFGADEADATIGVNLRGTADVCEALAPLLADRRGRVVNVSSRRAPGGPRP